MCASAPKVVLWRSQINPILVDVDQCRLSRFSSNLKGLCGIWFGSQKIYSILIGNGSCTDNVRKGMSRSLQAMRERVEAWMRQGISPSRLALTLALGFVIGCLPMFGIPTALCLVVALGLRLNLPAIQAANYAAMPLQIALIFPFVRLGGWMFASAAHPAFHATPGRGSALKLIWASGNLAGEAMAAWLVTAVPMVVLMTLALTALLRRIPALAEAEAAEG
jgi:uncharacterized protein (DUF2062 family)